jgi:hypothetical protein
MPWAREKHEVRRKVNRADTLAIATVQGCDRSHCNNLPMEAAMAELTNEQRAFLRSHKIAPSSVFNASGMKSSEWRSAMESEGKLVSIGVGPCKAGGHDVAPLG